jgi:hypothetical protein
MMNLDFDKCGAVGIRGYREKSSGYTILCRRCFTGMYSECIWYRTSSACVLVLIIDINGPAILASGVSMSEASEKGAVYVHFDVTSAEQLAHCD